MEPLVPVIVDLRDFPYMPLDVVRLRDSRLASHVSGEGFRCAVLLWCAAWHQVPSASLPDDDILLAQYAGFGRSVREWRKMRQQALHGWVLCDDGRFYHPTVAEKALEAWDQRLHQRWRTECARIKKAAQRKGFSPEYPSFKEWKDHFNATGSEQWCPDDVPDPVPRDNEAMSRGTEADVPGETTSKGREGKGRDSNKTPHSPPEGGAPAGKRKREKITFPGFIEACKLAGEKPIQPSDPIFRFAEDAGIPVEYLHLAWIEFAGKHRESGKFQKDWRAHFRDAVRRNWFKLWWFPSEGGCDLTTAGQQVRRALEAEQRRKSQHQEAA